MPDSVVVWLVGAMVLVALLAITGNDALRRRARIRRRLAPLVSLLETEQTAIVAPTTQREQAERPFADFMARRYPLSGGPRTGLAALLAGLGLAAVLVPALVFLELPLAFAVLIAILLGTLLGWNTGTFLEQRMRERYQDRLLVAIEDMQRMVRFGISTTQALESVATSAEEPVKGSLTRVALNTELGTPLGVALGREAHRTGISEMAMLAAIVSTQSRTGGGLAESVANLAEMLRERIDNRARIKASTAESKISLIILCFVPLAAIGIQTATQPEIVQTLLTSARNLLGIGIGLIVAGLTVAWFLVRSAQK